MAQLRGTAFAMRRLLALTRCGLAGHAWPWATEDEKAGQLEIHANCQNLRVYGVRAGWCLNPATKHRKTTQGRLRAECAAA